VSLDDFCTLRPVVVASSIPKTKPFGDHFVSMDTSDQVVYTGCWVVLLLYITTTLLVFTQRSCVGCAASFLFACVLLADLAIFNARFLLPSFARHIRQLDILTDSYIGLLRVIVTSEAAWDLYLMLLGWCKYSLGLPLSTAIRIEPPAAMSMLCIIALVLSTLNLYACAYIASRHLSRY
jgi:hypothetical protein